MLTIDRPPPQPELPQFRRDMEAFLVAAVLTRRGRRTLSPHAYWLAAVTAAVVAIAVTLGVVFTRGGPRPANPPGPLQLASFSVSSAPGGQVELTLGPGELRNPGALRRALANVGVPALVTANEVCYEPGPSAILTQVLSAPRHQAGGSTVWTITPTAIPSDVQLSIGYFHVATGFGVHVSLVPDHAALTCTASPPAPPHR